MKDLVPMLICKDVPASVTFYGMKEFDLVEPNGHVLCFGEDTDEEQTVEV